ncbi:hypothetical protein DVA67_031530 [Solirubrobacter sp. CPCC 204708]|nr:hypothetical protein [Solirubrobacter deserti]
MRGVQRSTITRGTPGSRRRRASSPPAVADGHGQPQLGAVDDPRGLDGRHVWRAEQVLGLVTQDERRRTGAVVPRRCVRRSAARELHDDVDTDQRARAA